MRFIRTEWRFHFSFDCRLSSKVVGAFQQHVLLIKADDRQKDRQTNAQHNPSVAYCFSHREASRSETCLEEMDQRLEIRRLVLRRLYVTLLRDFFTIFTLDRFFAQVLHLRRHFLQYTANQEFN